MALRKIRIEQVNSRDGFEQFARLPFQIYADRDAWWPPDIHNEIDLLAGRALITSHWTYAHFPLSATTASSRASAPWSTIATINIGTKSSAS